MPIDGHYLSRVPKAITMSIGASKFLIEIDEAVHLPPALPLVGPTVQRDVPMTLQPVANLMNIEREFAGVQELLVACCRGLHESIEKIPTPESVVVDFGIKLAGETGFPMISKASGEANFAVTITWKPGTGNFAGNSAPVADKQPSQS